MSRPTSTSRRTRIVGCALALFAVLALHLHGLHYYQAGMWLGMDVCSAADEKPSSLPLSGAALHLGAGCDLCCAHQPAPMAAGGAHALQEAVRPGTDPLAEAAAPAPVPPWPAHRPRGPPARA